MGAQRIEIDWPDLRLVLNLVLAFSSQSISAPLACAYMALDLLSLSLLLPLESRRAATQAYFVLERLPSGEESPELLRIQYDSVQFLESTASLRQSSASAQAGKIPVFDCAISISTMDLQAGSNLKIQFSFGELNQSNGQILQDDKCIVNCGPGNSRCKKSIKICLIWNQISEIVDSTEEQTTVIGRSRSRTPRGRAGMRSPSVSVRKRETNLS